MPARAQRPLTVKRGDKQLQVITVVADLQVDTDTAVRSLCEGLAEERRRRLLGVRTRSLMRCPRLRFNKSVARGQADLPKLQGRELKRLVWHFTAAGYGLQDKEAALCLARLGLQAALNERACGR